MDGQFGVDPMQLGFHGFFFLVLISFLKMGLSFYVLFFFSNSFFVQLSWKSQIQINKSMFSSSTAVFSWVIPKIASFMLLFFYLFFKQQQQQQRAADFVILMCMNSETI